MKRMRIVTDSVGDIPADLAAVLEIDVIPCLVYVGQTVYRDGVDLTPREFFRQLSQRPALLRTSQPAMADFIQTYRRLLDEKDCDGILSIHVASGFSGTINAAWAAAQAMPDPSRIHVIDSGSVSMGMGWMVIQAARLAQAGASRQEIVHALEGIGARRRTAAMVDRLDNLVQGGRLHPIVGTLGTALRIKPLISLDNGEAIVWGRVRTRSRALETLVRQVRAWGPLAELALLHADAEDLLHDLVRELGDRVPADRLIIEPAGAALVAHLGLGAVGACALMANGQAIES